MRDTPPERFAQRVREEVQRLQEAGYSKGAIAERAGIARSVLDRYEKGGMPDSPSRLAALAKTFGCSMDYLWDRVDERTGHYRGDTEAITAAAEAMTRAAAELQRAVQGTAR